MKILFFMLLTFMTVSSHAQLLVDDFTTGNVSVKKMSVLDTDEITYQKGAMLGGHRKLLAKLRQHTDKQDLQYGILNKKLVASFGYNSRGGLKVSYGRMPSGAKPLDVDLTKYTKLVVTYEGLSENSPFYISLFTNSQRAVYSQSVPRRPGIYRLEIPFSKFKIIGQGFKWNDLDSMQFQFGASALTGNNFAVTRIEFK